MANGTYDNPRAGSNSSKNRMKSMIEKINDPEKQLFKLGEKAFSGEVGESGMTASKGNLKVDLLSDYDYDAPGQETTFSKTDKKGNVKKTIVFTNSELDDDLNMKVNKKVTKIKKKNRKPYVNIENQ
jgi:hypothetical protein